MEQEKLVLGKFIAKDGQIRIVKPFGPSIALITIPSELVQKLNEYIDKVFDDKKKSKELDHGKYLAGNVSQEFRLEKKFSDEIGWTDFLKKSSAAWINFATSKKITKFEIINSWVVRQFQNEYNPLHWHGGHISGVGYLKVPKNLGGQVQKENKIANPNGHLELIHGSRMFLSESQVRFVPQVGNFYFFPNYMMHAVYPFAESNEERRSISFNAKIDDDIYNVYGG